MNRFVIAVLGLLVAGAAVQAEELIVPMHLTDSAGIGKSIGHVKAASNSFGVVFTPDLKGLTPGLHGFHVHQNPDCGPGEKGGKKVPGLAAGGHYDPTGAGEHKGPYQDGHLGDLPALHVDAEGNASHPILAPRLRLSDLKGRSLMIHAGGDNYSDNPEKLGGGGARVACGVVN